MIHYILDARTATPHFPGIGRYVNNLARALIPLLDDNEHLTVLHDANHDLYLPRRKAVRALPVRTSPFSLQQQWKIPNLIRKLKADLYHSAYYLMPYRPGVPTLLTLYDLIPILLPEHSSMRARLLFRLTTSLALRTAQHTLAISEATRRDFLEHFRLSPEHITTVPLAADPAFKPQSQAAKAAFRSQFNLPERFVLYLGSNKPHKNLTRLIEAFAHAKVSDIPLVVAGAWLPQHPEPRERAHALGLDARVHWLGPAQGKYLPQLYAAATAFVFPSLYEGFGLPPLEAMACGTPVACSDTSSLPEVVGEAALRFPPTDVNAIAEAITALLSDAALRSDLQARSLHRARQFSWSRTAEETLAIYRVLTDNS